MNSPVAGVDERADYDVNHQQTGKNDAPTGVGVLCGHAVFAAPERTVSHGNPTTGNGLVGFHGDGARKLKQSQKRSHPEHEDDRDCADGKADAQNPQNDNHEAFSLKLKNQMNQPVKVVNISESKA